VVALTGRRHRPRRFVGKHRVAKRDRDAGVGGLAGGAAYLVGHVAASFAR
jgi:hypothetical protein